MCHVFTRVDIRMLPWCRYGTGESFLFRFAPPDAAAQLLPAQALRQSLKDEVRKKTLHCRIDLMAKKAPTLCIGRG